MLQMSSSFKYCPSSRKTYFKPYPSLRLLSVDDCLDITVHSPFNFYSRTVLSIFKLICSEAKYSTLNVFLLGRT